MSLGNNQYPVNIYVRNATAFDLGEDVDKMLANILVDYLYNSKKPISDAHIVLTDYKFTALSFTQEEKVNISRVVYDFSQILDSYGIDKGTYKFDTRIYDPEDQNYKMSRDIKNQFTTNKKTYTIHIFKQLEEIECFILESIDSNSIQVPTLSTGKIKYILPSVSGGNVSTLGKGSSDIVIQSNPNDLSDDIYVNIFIEMLHNVFNNTIFPDMDNKGGPVAEGVTHVISYFILKDIGFGSAVEKIIKLNHPDYKYIPALIDNYSSSKNPAQALYHDFTTNKKDFLAKYPNINTENSIGRSRE